MVKADPEPPEDSMKTPWTDEHSRLVADACRPPEPSSDADLSRVWNRITGEMEVAKPRTRRRLRIVIGAGVVATVLGASGYAAAEVWSAHTGRGPVDAEDLLLGGPGERLNPAAPDFGEVVAKETRDIPFPSATSRSVAVAAQVEDNAGDPGTTASMSTGALRAWVADAAICAWSDQWARATHSGDDAARDEAVRVLDGAPGWEAVTAIDPDPTSTPMAIDSTDRNGRLVHQVVQDATQFYYLAELSRAVHGRDVDAVAAVLARENGYCVPALVPDIPRANPMLREG
jgi:hypothetical protein